MYKEYLKEHGRGIMVFLRDTTTVEEAMAFPVTCKTYDLIANIIKTGTYDSFSEEDAILFLKDFVEPAAWKDIDLTKRVPMRESVHMECQAFWENMPLNMRNSLYQKC